MNAQAFPRAPLRRLPKLPAGGLTLIGRLLLGIWLVGLMPGCSEPSERNEAPATNDERFTESDRVALMESHYRPAIEAHDMLIRDHLDAFRSNLQALATEALPSQAPESWKARHESMREKAKLAATASNLDEAAAGLASVVEVCGLCHAALLNGPVYQEPAPEEGASAVQNVMLRHQWATERLWEGVTGPWDDAWKRGADELIGTAVFATGDARATQLHELEEELRAVGRRARQAANLSERAQLYGQLLAGCARCHREANVPFEAKSP